MTSQRARFEALVLPHLDAAYRLASGLARSASDAEDVVQEAMLRAFQACGNLRSDDAKPWLLAIVRNCHWSAERQRRAFVPLAEEAQDAGSESVAGEDWGPEEQVAQLLAGRELDQLLAQLRLEYREVLHLREVEDLSYREIAAVIGLPIGTVMSRLARGRAALQALWLARAQRSGP